MGEPDREVVTGDVVEWRYRLAPKAHDQDGYEVDWMVLRFEQNRLASVARETYMIQK
jgi:hypothetical protein